MAEKKKTALQHKRIWLIIIGLVLVLIGVVWIISIYSTGQPVMDKTLLAPTLFSPPGAMP